MSATNENENQNQTRKRSIKTLARSEADRPDDELLYVSRRLQQSGRNETPKVNLAKEITPIMKWVPGDSVELSLRQDPLRVVVTPEEEYER